jgi:putative endonuclease
MKQNTRQFGQEQEQKACDYLEQQDLKVIEKNYQCKVGEIDLIMRDKDNILVFVEVRFRKQNSYGGGLESVTRSKQRRIIRTAQYYLLTKKEDCPCRFDVIAIEPEQKFHWIKDAFWVKY